MYTKKQQAARYGKGYKKSVKITTADHNFSIYIRIRDIITVVDGMTLEAYCKCISCGKIKPWKGLGFTDTNAMQAGHYIPRGEHNLRFNELNVHAQCWKCNIDLNGNIARYGAALDRKYGVGTASKLVDLADVKKYRPYSKDDLKTMTVLYKQKSITLAEKIGLDKKQIRRMCKGRI